MKNLTSPEEYAKEYVENLIFSIENDEIQNRDTE